MKRNRRNRQKKVKLTTYGEFLILLPLCHKDHQDELLEKLKQAKRPNFVCGKEVPANLNTITYGQLDDFSRLSQSGEDPAVKIFSILLGLEAPQVYELNVFDVFGMLNFVRSELEHINALFASIKVTHSSEEIAAGVEDLNFGTFGVIDWYAKRMGITNQDEVYNVAWIRIYTCMKNDNEKAEYEQRLNKQYMEKAKRKR